MKKLLLTTSALILGLSLSNNASAECNGMYIAARAGAVKHDYSQKSGSIASMNTDGLDSNKFMLSGALGYRYDYIRTELEYVWRDKSEKKYSFSGASTKYNFKSYSMMLNGYIDLAPYSWFTPYVSAGIGFTTLKYRAGDTTAAGSISHTSNGNYDPTRFTWSVGGGLSIKVTNRFNVDAGYRYYDMGSIKNMDVTAQEIYGGIRYVF